MEQSLVEFFHLPITRGNDPNPLTLFIIPGYSLWRKKFHFQP